jgi:hypothetical protein
MVVTETTCFLCHFKTGGEVDKATFDKLSDCQTCHKWEKTNTHVLPSTQEYHLNLIERNVSCDRCHSQTLVGDGFVPRETCFSCHWDNERLDKIGETTLLHSTHIKERKIECVQCHLQIQHKIQRVASDSELRCETCHTGTHNEQVALFTGRVPSVVGAPSPMYEAGLDCAGCHVFHSGLVGDAPESENGEAQIARPQSCETCHGAGYDRLLKLWQEGADAKALEFERDLNRVARAVRNTSSAKREAAAPPLDAATSTLHIVRVGKPVHNLIFYDQVIRSGYEKLQEALAASGANLSLPAYNAVSSVPGQCANCHTGVEQVTTRFEDYSFSHERHVVENGVTCSTCHSNVARHGQMILSRQMCNDCHHREATQPESAVTCESCHTEAASIYSGTYLDRDVPDYMFAEEVSCVDCHNQNGRIVRPQVAVCLDCHDEGYDQDAANWQSEIDGLIQEVSMLIDANRLSAAQQNDSLVRQARDVLRNLETGAARGVHNYELTSELLLELKKGLEPPSQP